MNEREQKLKTRLLKEIEQSLADSKKVPDPSIVVKVAKVLEIDHSITLNDLMTYRNWFSHTRIDRPQAGQGGIVDHINQKLSTIRAQNNLAPDEYFEGIYDRHYFWSEFIQYLTMLQPLLWDLKTFCKHFGLKTSALYDEGWWYRFKKGFLSELIDVEVRVTIPGCPIKTICITSASEKPPKGSVFWFMRPVIGRLGFFVVQESVYADNDVQDDLIVINKR